MAKLREKMESHWLVGPLVNAIKTARYKTPSVCKICGGECGQCGGHGEPSYIWDARLGRDVRNKDF